MGQKPSRRIESSPQKDGSSAPEEYPPSGRILNGAYIIRNKASGTVLHLVSPYEYEIGEHCDVVGWTQESTDLETLGRQTWWVEWDDKYHGYVISNINNRGMVLDVMGPRSFMISHNKRVSEKDREKLVCARPRVRNLASARSSVRSSRRNSLELVRRDEVYECQNGGDALALTEQSVGERIKSQRWILKRSTPTSETFSIHNLLYPSIVLDLDWGKTENNTKIQLCTRTGVNHQQWNFIVPSVPSMNPPIGSWVFLVNEKTGSFLHHADMDYPPAAIKIGKWEGITEKREFWGLHWTFILAEDKEGLPKWYIRNRLTNTLLEHWGGRKKGDSVKADSHLFTETKEWRVELLTKADGAKKPGVWGLVNVESGCALDHYNGKSVQCYQPGTKDESKHWRIMEVSCPFVDTAAATLQIPPSSTPVPPALSMSCTELSVASYPASPALQPLVMPSPSSFYFLEPSIWPFPTAAPSSRDALGHEERSFFELLSRIETQLIFPGPYASTMLMRTVTTSAPVTPLLHTPTVLPPRPRSAVLTIPMGFFELVTHGKGLSVNHVPHTGGKELVVHGKDNTLTLIKTNDSNRSSSNLSTLSMPPLPATHTRKRILAETEGWTMWALGYSKNGYMSNWNSLVESSVVRHADRRDRYIVCFYEAVVVIRELLTRYYESQNAILAAQGWEEDQRAIVLPSRIAWLIMLATSSLDKVIKLRKMALEVDGEVYGRMGIEMRETEGQAAARQVNQWVIKELERVRVGWKAIEVLVTAGAARARFVH
ncbi:hypothetical protein BDZ91DRAFT_312237 [Kalaharituber pfeilii]|nr:hypothetical protein BDZ91DRAFT_312237 [Kalaharituber pfeilii]